MINEIEASVLMSFREAYKKFDDLGGCNLSLETRVNDLGIDSIILLEIVGYIEDELNVNLSEDELIEVKKVGDISRLVAIQLI